MESKEPIILNPEDFQDYHKLARKVFGASPKGGRPSKEETEFKEYLKDLYQFRLAKEAGLLSTYLGNLTPPEGDTDRSGSGDEQNIFEGILKGDFGRIIDISAEGAEEAIRNATKYGLPIVSVLGAVWIAENKVKDFPPLLHTSFELLIQILRLVTILGNFIGTGLGGITDFIKDPIDTIRVTLGGQKITDIKKFDTLSPEQQQAFLATPIGKQICTFPEKEQLRIFGLVICPNEF